jgi:DNA-binding transcriptional LysR family regulator
MLDVHRLRLLRELRHRGPLAAVARALGYSPSTVSHQLDVLEREAGVPLLEPAADGCSSRQRRCCSSSTPRRCWTG